MERLTHSDMSPAIDLDAEKAVLGSVLLDAAVLDEITFLEPRDFSQERNELIYKVMRYFSERDKPIDLLTITEQFHNRGKLKDIGGQEYLFSLSNAVPTAANAIYYARIVRSKAHRRRGSKIGQMIVGLSADDFEDDEAYFSAVDDLVADLRPQESGNLRTFAETRTEYFRHLKSKAEKLKTGLFKQFDEWAQLWRGWLMIVAGRPGVGKTAEALMLAYGIAKYNPGEGAVMIYSQEMDENEVKDRMVSMIAEVNYPRLINKGGEEGFTDKEWEKIETAYNLVERLPLYISDAAGISISQIRADAKRIKKKHGKIAAIIVDYLQIMDIPDKNNNRAQAIGYVTKTAKTMARNMKFVFIMLSQLDRSVDNEEPKLRHLRESGSIEQDADVVQFLWWDGEEVDQSNKARIIQSIFAKGRNIGLNRFRLRFDWWIQRYTELDKKAPTPEGGGKSNGRKKNSK